METGTVAVALNTVAASGGVDAVFLLEWMGVVVLSIVLMKLILPFMPFLNPILDLVNPTLTTLERALPGLRNKPWFQKAQTAVDVIDTARRFVKLAEVNKATDPNGALRRAAVKAELKAIYGVKHNWTPEQEAAVEKIIDTALANEDLIGKAAQGILPDKFRSAVVGKEVS